MCRASPHRIRPTPNFQKLASPPSHISREFTDMDPPASPRPRKRRAINACVSCRTSKVRCDGNRPCQRCDRNGTSCQYHDAVKDENVLRIEKLEGEVAMIREHMRIQQRRDKSVRRHL
jgi:hypothetical protein